jgi:hypothetical protein
MQKGSKKKSRALLIGCGRIGAGNEDDWANCHAGALSQQKNWTTMIYDRNLSIAKKAGQIHSLQVLDEIKDEDLNSIRIATICTPTANHLEYLERLICSGVPIIVCEKPIAVDEGELERAKKIYKKGKSRVLVNYTRRFMPSYIALKKQIAKISEGQKLRACQLRYQRGFLNNASHGLDLIQFLLGWNIEKANAKILDSVYDEFADDPTVSCWGQWNDTKLSILGIPHVKFSLFEIDLFFEREVIRIKDRGNTIELDRADKPGAYYAALQSKKIIENCISDPFIELYRIVEKMISFRRIQDNFMSSISMAQWMINIQK